MNQLIQFTKLYLIESTNIESSKDLTQKNLSENWFSG